MNENKQEIPDGILKFSPRLFGQEIGTYILFLILMPGLAILYWGGRFYVTGGLCILLGLYNLWKEGISFKKSYMQFTETEFSGKINGGDFKLGWDTIESVQFRGQGIGREIILHTASTQWRVPCKFFDEKVIVSLMQEHLSARVFEPFIHHKLAVFQEWKTANEARFASLTQPLKVSIRVSQRWIGVLGLGGAAIGSGILYTESMYRSFFWLAGFIGFSLGVLLVVLDFTWMEATNEYIAVYTPVRRYEIRWRCLSEFYTNPNQTVVALVGENCRVMLPNPASLSGKDREQLAELLNFKLEISEIEPAQDWKYIFWRSKSCDD